MFIALIPRLLQAIRTLYVFFPIIVPFTLLPAFPQPDFSRLPPYFPGNFKYNFAKIFVPIARKDIFPIMLYQGIHFFIRHILSMGWKRDGQRNHTNNKFTRFMWFAVKNKVFFQFFVQGEEDLPFKLRIVVHADFSLDSPRRLQ